MSTVDVQSCHECGASIYPEHLQSHKAGYWGGKLCCVHCYSEHRNHQATVSPQDVVHTSPSAARLAAGGSPAGGVSAPAGPDLDDLESKTSVAGNEQPIMLVDIPEAELAMPPVTMPPVAARRPAEPEARRGGAQRADGRGATRCRIFHAKLNDGALKFMQEQINDWIDQHPEVEIKHASTQVGVVEGKSAEPHLIITVFY
jgi:DNA-directed RNA polymerase subunit M/transcription elongation factor TFIIS